MQRVESSVEISMSPQEVMDAFTQQEHLKAWWGVNRSLIELKRGGLYSLVWQSKEDRLDYVSSGVIAEYLPACQLRIENFVYINPERQVLGPMELFILTTPEKNNLTQLTVIQSGYQTGRDWEWLHEAVKDAWPKVLQQVKEYLESIKVSS